MKKSLLIWVTAVVLIIIAVFVTKIFSNNTDKVITLNKQTLAQNGPELTLGTASNDVIGEKAIDFTLEDLYGKKVSLKDYKGKNVYLNFFATWCPPCISEMPDIEKVFQEYNDQDLVVLAVNLGEDKDKVKNFVKKNNYSFRVLLDSDQSVGQQYNITGIPVSYFIDKKGNIVTKRVGALTGDEIESYVKMLLQKE